MSRRSFPAATSLTTPAGHQPEPYGVERRSTRTASTESVPIWVVAPDVTRASTVSHLRVGVLKVEVAKSPCSTARQRRVAPVAHVGVVSTKESSFTPPSNSVSLI